MPVSYERTFQFFQNSVSDSPLMSGSLGAALVDWKSIAVPDITYTALFVCDFEKLHLQSYEVRGILEAVVFAGCYTGEVIRWMILDTDVRPVTASFGHTSKVVQFAECCFPIVQYAVASLSFDGSFAIWNAIDGLCIRSYKNILPKGCQRFATSKHAIELAVVSGAFPCFYILNLQTGVITQKIRPVSMRPICLSFYSHGNKEWMFTMESNGCASYTPITSSGSKRMRLFNPAKKVLLSAIPSPDFSYLIVIFKTGYALVSLCRPGFPKYVDENCPDINTAVWMGLNKYIIVMYNGSYKMFSIDSSPQDRPHADLLMPVGGEQPITSSVSWMSEEQFVQYKAKIDIIMNPLSPNMSFEPIRLTNTEERMGETESEIFQPRFILSADVLLPMPLVCVWKNEVVIAFDDTIIIGAKGYAEFSLSDFFAKKRRSVTCQCFLLIDKLVEGIIRGRTDGYVVVKKFGSGKSQKAVLSQRHQGKVVSMCTTLEYLFTSGDDAIVNVYSLRDLKFVSSIPIFVTPVLSFRRVCHKTKTHYDRFLFCVSEDRNVGIIDLKSLELVLVLTGHDSDIEHVYLHPAMNILLVQSRSLYFWSLITGNLESIVTGYEMSRYLETGIGQFVEVIPPKNRHFGISYVPTRFGSMLLRVANIDVEKLAMNIEVRLKQFSGKDLKTALSNLHNLQFVMELLSGKARKRIANSCVPGFSKMFRVGSIGYDDVPTVYLPGTQVRGKVHWQISPQVSAAMTVTRGWIVNALRSHPEIAENFHTYFRQSPFSFTTKIPNFQKPDVFLLFKYTANAPERLRKLVMEIVSFVFSAEERQKWLTMLPDAIRCFPNQQALLTEITKALSSSS